jgi:hypothetical protein
MAKQTLLGRIASFIPERAQKLTSSPQPTQQQAATATSVSGMGGYGRTSGTTYVSNTAAALVGYAFRCLEIKEQRRAKVVPQFFVEINQDELTPLEVTHWLPQLYKRPNKFYSPMQTRIAETQSLEYYGSAYCYLPHFGQDRPYQYWVLDPNRIYIDQDPDTLVRTYGYYTQAKGYIIIQPHEMLHKRFINISTQQTMLKGYPRLASLFDSLSINAELKAFLSRYFKADALPPIVFTLKGGAHMPAPEIKATIRNDWNEVLPNHKVAGFMPEGLDLTPIQGMSSKTAEQIIAQNAGQNVVDEICDVIGVPKAIVQMSNDSYASSIQHSNDFLTGTIQPLCDIHADAETHYFSRYIDNIVIKHEVELQRDKEYELRAKVALGFIPNEERKAVGAEPVPDGDSLLIPAAYMPLTQVMQGGAGANADAVPTEAPAPSQAEQPTPVGSGASLKKKDNSNDDSDDPFNDKAFADAYWNKAIKKQSAKMEGIRRAVVGSLADLEAEVLRNFKKASGKYYTAAGRPRKNKSEVNDDFDLFDVDEFMDRFFDDATPAIRELVSSTLIESLQEVGENWDGIESEFDRRLETIIRDSASKIKEPVQTIHSELNRLLVRMKDNNIDEVTDAIKEKFSGYSDGRAKAIARTTSTATNGSAQRSAWDAVNIQPAWLSQRAGTTRVTHRKADGSKPDSAGYFRVGADKMKSPGTGGLAEENINCQCVLRPVARASKHVMSLKAYVNIRAFAA